jgi:hypothetical protein
MSTHVLIRDKSGEEMLVLDPKKHKGCKILEKGVTPLKHGGAQRVKGRWRFDKEEARRIARMQELKNPVKALGIIEALEARLQALESKIEKS